MITNTFGKFRITLKKYIRYTIILLLLAISVKFAEGQESSVQIICQNTIFSGEYVPVILRFYFTDGKIDSTLTTTVTLTDGVADFRSRNVKIIRGVGSVTSKVTSSSDFTLGVSGFNETKQIQLNNNPSEQTHSGTIRNTETWHNSQIHIITDDITLSEGVRLTIDAGTRIYIERKKNFDISGSLVLEGTELSPILFSTQDHTEAWGGIKFLNGSQYSELEYTIFTRGGGDNDRNYGHSSSQPILKAEETNMELSNCFLIDNIGKGIASEESTVVITNSLISRCDTGAEFRYSNSTITGLYVLFIPDDDGVVEDDDNDGLYVWNQLSSNPETTIIERVVIYSTEDEGIDFNSRAKVEVRYSFISHIHDKGLSVGNASHTEFYGNQITHCEDAAIGAKDNSFVLVNKCTLYKNAIGLLGYTKNEGQGGGNITAKNLIISESSEDSYSDDANSSLNISYSLSDTDQIPGTGNIEYAPRFTDTDNFDFSLSENSPAIDAGDPSGPRDPDGTIADIGAIYYNHGTTSNDLLICEVHYHPIKGGQEDMGYEFIEIVNSSDQQLSIGGYSLEGAVDYTFPAGTSISADEYVVVCASSDNYSDLDAQVFDWNSGELSNNGDYILLKDNTSSIISEITYSYLDPWPNRQQISNVSIELISLDLPVSQADSWQHSLVDGGTPGKANVRPLLADIYINELVSKYGTSYADEFGNYSDWIEIYNANSFPVYLNTLYITDDLQEPMAFQLAVNEPDDLRIGGKGFLVLFADANSDLGSKHVDFQLASAGESVGIGQKIGGNYHIIDQIEFDHLDLDQSYGRAPDGASNFQIFDIPTPGASNEVITIDKYLDLKINELVAKYDNSYPDEHGLHSDWIEIYNSGKGDVNLLGLFLSDNIDDPKKHQVLGNIGDSAVIQSGGYLVFRPDAKTKLGFNHLGFELSSGGEDVVLSVLIGGELEIIDQKTYPRQVQGKSYGRLGNGSKWWAIFGNPTPGAPNGSTSLQTFATNHVDLKIYPNPVDDVLTIFLSGNLNDIESVEIFNIKGENYKTWHRNELTTFLKWDLYVQTQKAPPGIYIIRIRERNKSITRRFIIK